jgi:membrane-bound serine protease (ClpP class)
MDKKRYISLSLIALFVLFSFALGVADEAAKSESNENIVYVVTLSGIINPVASEFLSKNITKANEMNAEAIVIELDTPGGLMDSMRDIIKAMSASEVPVVVYVSPDGARAASAGAFITIAAHVAAMAPQTNIGAAHPVNAGGGQMDETMADKVTNDAVAYIKSLAKAHGRNEVWAEDAVRKSISSTADEALNENVIDLVSPSLDALLTEIDGRVVQTAAGEVTLHTKGAKVVREEMGLRHRILDLISNPNIAYMLMMLGFYGLFFELTNPGAVFPGVVGGISLILAFYAFQSLPVNYAGVLLILLAIVMFVLETQSPTFGALAIGGIISMVLGSIMLFDKAGPLFRVSISVILTTTGITAGFFVIVVGLVIRAYKRKPATGSEAMVGLEGKANSDVTSKGGTVYLHGEIWSATSEEPIEKGEAVVVESNDGLRIKIKRN